ncbi:MAG: AAA family ATPase [Planctomycetota bacterium]
MSVKIHLPHLQQLTLEGFSLFHSQRRISLAVNSGVFCLAGANGIGKSTVLAAVSYALTGIIPEPQRKFTSVDEYYKDCLKFAQQYFTGRIREKDRSQAAVELRFKIGDAQYQINRGLFDANALRMLRIDRPGEVVEPTDSSDTERDELYRKHLAADVGVSRFQQYAFLHHHVMTFDERHHLLFWDEKILEQALHLAFGVDFQAAQSADNLGREIERADSRARNANWQATEVAKKIKDIKQRREQLKEADKDADAIEYIRLTQERDEAVATVEKRAAAVNDAELQVSRSSAKLANAQHRFKQAFSDRINTVNPWVGHPVFVLSANRGRCTFCGDDSEGVVGRIEEARKRTECPLCGSPQEQELHHSDSVEALERIDAELEQLREVLQSSMKRIDRERVELDAATDDLEAISVQITKIESASPELRDIGGSGSNSTEIDAVLDIYEKQRQDLLREKVDQRKRRDTAKKTLKKLRQGLESQYSEAEEDFVPAFRELARLFLGLDLDVELQTRRTGVGLVLEVRGEKRREHFSLSESQKYFVDIALRMAIASHVTGDAVPATLFVDTPEGSLDIAYEARAGEMFARFVEMKNQLIMTANVNSSRLLIRLAERCGGDQMDFVRMMDWAELSDVQLDEEALFEQAYADIDAAFQRAGA